MSEDLIVVSKVVLDISMSLDGLIAQPDATEVFRAFIDSAGTR